MNPQARRRRGRSEQRQERTFAMRLYLLAFLALFGMNAMAADNWKAFPTTRAPMTIQATS